MTLLANKFNTKPEVPSLWEHQKETEELCHQTPVIYDTSDPGTGKTAAHLTAFAKRRQAGAGPALVVAPKTLLETAWGSDARLFVPNMSISVAWATNRAQAFEEEADIYITNTDAVKWLMLQKPRWLKRKFAESTLIIDEITTYKNHTSAKRAKDALKLSTYFDYRHGLTGTPFNKSVTEMWAQVKILDGGQRLGNKFYAFRQTVCDAAPIYGTVHSNWVDKPGAEEAVSMQLADISIRHNIDDCMDIPTQHIYTRGFSLSSTALAAYKELEENAKLLLRKGEITAVNAAVLRGKLLQIASGAVYESENNYHVIDVERYLLVADLIEEAAHSVVFFIWKHQKDQMIDILTKRRISYAVIDGSVTNATDRADIVRRYQAGEYQTILLHPRTGAHGITLTTGTRTIWCSPVYSPDLLLQGNARTRRGSQTQRTESILVHAEGTVEDIVYAKLQHSKAKLLSLLDMLEIKE